MKSVITLIGVAAMCGLFTSVAIGRNSTGPTANNDSGGAAIQDRAPGAKGTHARRTARQPQSELPGIESSVVSEMRATKAFVKENVNDPREADRGLMLVAATGLIVLQLRRKHKSLPQRPIAP